MDQITPIIDFGSELASPFGLDGKVAYLTQARSETKVRTREG